MNKKIKVIELLNKISNGEEMPKEIKFDNEVFVYIDKWEQYVTKEEEIPLLRRIWDYNYSGLNEEVEILEDNTEEIDELKYDVVDENGKGWYKLDTIADKVTELIKAVNQIRKDLKDEWWWNKRIYER